MKQGTTVIFNQDYIDELIRHRDIAQKKYDVENIESQKLKAKQNLQMCEQRLEFAENFRDTIFEIKNMDIPHITAVKTMDGHEFPASVLQVI